MTSKTSSHTFNIAAMAGDGIGREAVAEAVRLLRTLGDYHVKELPWSADYYLRTGINVPPGGY